MDSSIGTDRRPWRPGSGRPTRRTGYNGPTNEPNAPRIPRAKFAAMKHLKPHEAAQFLHDNPSAVFIDCRSEMEYFFVGHPVGAHHVAWNDGPDWDINPHFVGQVKKVASMNRPIVLICRSGHRSLDAGDALEKAGLQRRLQRPRRIRGTARRCPPPRQRLRLADGRPALGAAVGAKQGQSASAMYTTPGSGLS